ncbi:hypothetical protein KC356_g8961 [Hortaea werneckii]|nr:hypothetical protein KC323_g7548 [Hortaea werneckii]KAI7081682.1 hypothetical protein KC356_g8961 [Hortaea werneckii]KAI7107711.1 hypothetical protein KC339_g2139 [Hortaea werneckii]KAI7241852.1 hypothetical protein KC365_g3358 [Hortaea werneckii]KAI7330607.1 hypothetical protein KC340_g4125 [Hortaea werneckii]
MWPETGDPSFEYGHPSWPEEPSNILPQTTESELSILPIQVAETVRRISKDTLDSGPAKNFANIEITVVAKEGTLTGGVRFEAKQ